jgi:mRNA-degrading endonuclease RelE of RelBE toxin-antitoxin system
MSWIYIELPSYIRACDDCGLSDEIKSYIKQWAPTVYRTPTPRLHVVFRTPLNRYEAWNARIPDPGSNRGKSGGFRILYFLDTKDGTINMIYIEERKELGFKGEGSRKGDKYSRLIEGVKEMLNRLEKANGC